MMPPQETANGAFLVQTGKTHPLQQHLAGHYRPTLSTSRKALQDGRQVDLPSQHPTMTMLQRKTLNNQNADAARKGFTSALHNDSR
jgi:hypothetical protein